MIKNILKRLSNNFYLINHAITLCKLGSKGNILKFFYLSLLLIITSLSTTLPILIVIPFITTISDPEKIWRFEKIRSTASLFGIYNPNELFLPFLLLFISVVGINSYLSVYTIKFNNNLKASIGHQLSKLAYKKVIYSTYEYYLSTSSSKIITDFLESIRRCVESISCFIDGITGFFAFSFILITLFIVSKEITFILIAFVSVIYFLLGLLKSKIIKKEGRILSISRNLQTELIQETLGSKKDLILMNNQKTFIKKFTNINSKAEFAEKKIETALQSPKSIVEGFFIILLGALAYILKSVFDIDPIPALSSIALGLQKLLPAAFMIYSSYVGIRYRYDLSRKIIDLIKNTPQDINFLNLSKIEPISFEEINLNKINYFYPKTSKKIISNGSLIIKRGEAIGIIGKTGSGKSTLIDLIMGFIKPQSGEILLDKINILEPKNEEVLTRWRKSIAHVPQTIFLRSSTIIENIAYGRSIDEIDFEKAKSCCEAAQILNFINSTENGMYTMVGERGINLSGGQIQRIAIARALYRDAEVLVLDEATSALDRNTEEEVVESLKNYHKKITIISISHRLSTVSNYDRLIKIIKGQILSV